MFVLGRVLLIDLYGNPTIIPVFFRGDIIDYPVSPLSN